MNEITKWNHEKKEKGSISYQEVMTLEMTLRTHSLRDKCEMVKMSYLLPILWLFSSLIY